MLNEKIEFEAYTYPKVCEKDKYNYPNCLKLHLITDSFTGIRRPLLVIARHYLNNGYFSELFDRKLYTEVALRLWLGDSNALTRADESIAEHFVSSVMKLVPNIIQAKEELLGHAVNLFKSSPADEGIESFLKEIRLNNSKETDENESIESVVSCLSDDQQKEIKDNFNKLSKLSNNLKKNKDLNLVEGWLPGYLRFQAKKKLKEVLNEVDTKKNVAEQENSALTQKEYEHISIIISALIEKIDCENEDLKSNENTYIKNLWESKENGSKFKDENLSNERPRFCDFAEYICTDCFNEATSYINAINEFIEKNKNSTEIKQNRFYIVNAPDLSEVPDKIRKKIAKEMCPSYNSDLEQNIKNTVYDCWYSENFESYNGKNPNPNYLLKDYGLTRLRNNAEKALEGSTQWPKSITQKERTGIKTGIKHIESLGINLEECKSKEDYLNYLIKPDTFTTDEIKDSVCDAIVKMDGTASKVEKDFKNKLKENSIPDTDVEKAVTIMKAYLDTKTRNAFDIIFALKDRKGFEECETVSDIIKPIKELLSNTSAKLYLDTLLAMCIKIVLTYNNVKSLPSNYAKKAFISGIEDSEKNTFNDINYEEITMEAFHMCPKEKNYVLVCNDKVSFSDSLKNAKTKNHKDIILKIISSYLMSKKTFNLDITGMFVPYQKHEIINWCEEGIKKNDDVEIVIYKFRKLEDNKFELLTINPKKNSNNESESQPLFFEQRSSSKQKNLFKIDTDILECFKLKAEDELEEWKKNNTGHYFIDNGFGVVLEDNTVEKT